MSTSILVVDDNPDNLKLMVFLLRKHGYAVETAVDAGTALSALEVLRPALILMDVQLPGMDGLELTKRIKAAPETGDIPIIVVTAFAMKIDEQRAYDAGCDAYVAKPINTRAFPGIVAAVLERARPFGLREPAM